MLSYNKHKWKIKHNKIQLKQELWPPTYMNNGKLSHIYEKKGTKVIQSKESNAKIMNSIVIIQMKSFLNMLGYRKR